MPYDVYDLDAFLWDATPGYLSIDSVQGTLFITYPVGATTPPMDITIRAASKRRGDGQDSAVAERTMRSPDDCDVWG